MKNENMKISQPLATFHLQGVTGTKPRRKHKNQIALIIY